MIDFSRIKKNRRVFINFLLPFYNVYHFFSSILIFIKGNIKFLKTKQDYKRHNVKGSFRYRYIYQTKCIGDWYEAAGSTNSYFWQDLWAAKLIHDNNPAVHYDIGSRIDGFIAHLASFRDNVILIDIRAMESNIPGVSFTQADATNLEGIEDESVDSISALCSLEHFGLGRYGDPIDPDASSKAMHSIVRVLKKGGHAYIAVPIGKERLEFNAHRVFYASTVVREFAPLKLVEYSVINSDGIEKDVPIHKYDDDLYNRNGRFGLFHFVNE